MPGSYFDASREDDRHTTKAMPDGDLQSCKTNKKLHFKAMWKPTLVLVSGSRIPPAVLVGGTIFSTNTLSNNGTNLLAAVANAIFLLSFFPSTLITKLCLETSPKPQENFRWQNYRSKELQPAPKREQCNRCVGQSEGGGFLRGWTRPSRKVGDRIRV